MDRIPAILKNFWFFCAAGLISILVWGCGENPEKLFDEKTPVQSIKAVKQ